MSIKSGVTGAVSSGARKAGSVNQMFGYAFGAVYLLVGAAGFLVTKGIGFAATKGNNLIFFDVNPLHNIIHLAVGGLFVAGAVAGLRWSRRVNTLVGAVYLLVGVAGLFLLGREANIFALNHPDNALHLGSALLALTVARLGDRNASSSSKDESESPLEVVPVPASSSNGSSQASGLFAAGDVAPQKGRYRCSCNDFAVIVREGGRFPQCPVGKGHNYRFVPPKKRPASTTRKARTA